MIEALEGLPFRLAISDLCPQGILLAVECRADCGTPRTQTCCSLGARSWCLGLGQWEGTEECFHSVCISIYGWISFSIRRVTEEQCIFGLNSKVWEEQSFGRKWKGKIKNLYLVILNLQFLLDIQIDMSGTWLDVFLWSQERAQI